jgi:hypothetical protein
MAWIGIAIAVVCLYLAMKVAGFVFKMLLLAVVVGGLYWFAAPYLSTL